MRRTLAGALLLGAALIAATATATTAIGPGAALALAGPSGAVRHYLPTASAAGRSAFSLCPLTVVDLGAVSAARQHPGDRSRAAAVRAGDSTLGRIRAELPPGAILAVVAVSGWPGFGAKVGGTFAMVPGFLILLMSVANVRMTPGRAVAAVACGAALAVMLALVNYFVPVTGTSHIGGFFGQVLHGVAGGTLSRKISSNVASLTVTDDALLVPPVVVVAGLMLLRPSWFAVKTLPRAWAARPLLRVILAAIWVVAVLGWFAEDSGVTVPAAGLPFVLPLAIAVASALAYPGPQPPAAAGLSGRPGTGTSRRPRQAILDLPP